MEVIKKLSYIFSKHQKKRFVELCFIILIGSCLELIGTALVMPVVEIISNPEMIHENKLYNSLYYFVGAESDKNFTIVIIAFIALIYIIKNGYLIFMYYCQHKFTYNNQKIVGMRMMEGYMRREYAFHLLKNVSELQRNVKEDVEMLFSGVISAVQLLAEIITCVMLGTYLMYVDITISFGIVLTLLIFSFVFLNLSKRFSLNLGARRRNSYFEMNKWMRQSFEGVKEVKVLNREDMFISRVDAEYGKYVDAYCKQVTINVLPRPIFEAVCVSSLLFLIGIRAYVGTDLREFIPVLSAFAVVAFRLLPSFGRMNGYVNLLVFNKSAIDNVYEDLKEIDELEAEVDKTSNKHEVFKFANKISVCNVCFCYQGSNRFVLNGVSVDIPKNKTVAFIGATGAGKTTLVDLILGVITPSRGEILVDGVDIQDGLTEWRELIGYIPQTMYLLDDTIRNNIIFGSSEEKNTDERVWNALEEAQIADYVKTLEDGIDTIIGERGIRLSGGQRQRIGIARALYTNPQVLVLDEATSALDNETEKAVMEAIEKSKGIRTMIIIAHRLTTIKNCDEIYEVKQGKIEKKDKKDFID